MSSVTPYNLPRYNLGCLGMESLVERKPPLRFGERMRREYKYDGFMSIIVEGKQRIGKSS